MAEITSTKYGNEHKDKAIQGDGRFNQPTQFHPKDVDAHERDIKRGQSANTKQNTTHQGLQEDR